MQRRELLGLLGGIPVLLGLAPNELLALGRETHQRLVTDADTIGFFSNYQMNVVAAAGDRIIPTTDTPGAMAAGCHHFTERIIADRYDAKRQQRFLAGLVDLDQRSRRLNSRLFIECSPQQQDAVIGEVDAAAFDDEGKMLSNIFWRDFKYLTIYGYYTSQIGIEQELQTVEFPGHYDGYLPIAEASR